MWTAFCCIIFSAWFSSHFFFQANLRRLKKGLARGERLEALNIHRLAYMYPDWALEREEERKSNFKSLDSLFCCLGSWSSGGPQVFYRLGLAIYLLQLATLECRVNELIRLVTGFPLSGGCSCWYHRGWGNTFVCLNPWEAAQQYPGL